MNNIEILGYVAAFFTTAAAIPQLIKIIKTKHAGDVSIIMFLMTFIGVFLWLLYGLLLNSQPLIVANVLSAIIIASIIFSKLKYNNKVR
jgi:MtN3 and saliva related transmembrane protein